MEIRSLKPHELDAWTIHCEEVFTGVDRGYFLRHYQNDPWKDINSIFVAMDGDTIASTVRVFRRKVWLFGRETTMGGIGEVSTKEAYRGKGLSGGLLMKAIQWMEEQGIEVSVLYTGLYGHYSRYGWQVIPVLERRYERSTGTPCDCRIIVQEDIFAMAALEAKSEKQNWSLVRDSIPYWQNWFWKEQQSGKGLLVEQNGEVKAWLLYSLHENDWKVREFRALPGSEGLFDGLCAAAAQRENRLDQPFYAPGWLHTNAHDTVLTAEGYCMVRLITPILAAGETIDTTEKLILLSGDSRDSELDHF